MVYSSQKPLAMGYILPREDDLRLYLRERLYVSPSGETMYQSGVYSIENTVNGNIYIGSTKNLKRRMADHCFRLRRRDHHCRHLQNAWNKYGEESFRFFVLEYCLPEELVYREQCWIDSLVPEYNIAKKAYSPLGISRSEETKKLMSAAQKGNKKMLGKRHTDETRAKMSKAMKGNTNTLGKKFTEEHKAKIRSAKIGISRSMKSVAKMSATKIANGVHRGEKNSSAKLDIQKVVIIRYLKNKHKLTNQKIADLAGVSSSVVSKCIRGESWSHVLYGIVDES